MSALSRGSVDASITAHCNSTMELLRSAANEGSALTSAGVGVVAFEARCVLARCELNQLVAKQPTAGRRITRRCPSRGAHNAWSESCVTRQVETRFSALLVLICIECYFFRLVRSELQPSIQAASAGCPQEWESLVEEYREASSFRSRRGARAAARVDCDVPAPQTQPSG